MYSCKKTLIQGGSNMTGTNCDLFYTQIVPVIFEPPCISEENYASIFRVIESACTWSSSTAQRSIRKRHSPKTVQSCPHEVTLPSICPNAHTHTNTHTQRLLMFQCTPTRPQKRTTCTHQTCIVFHSSHCAETLER